MYSWEFWKVFADTATEEEKAKCELLGIFIAYNDYADKFVVRKTGTLYEWLDDTPGDASMFNSVSDAIDAVVNFDPTKHMWRE